MFGCKVSTKENEEVWSFECQMGRHLRKVGVPRAHRYLESLREGQPPPRTAGRTISTRHQSHRSSKVPPCPYPASRPWRGPEERAIEVDSTRTRVSPLANALLPRALPRDGS